MRRALRNSLLEKWKKRVYKGGVRMYNNAQKKKKHSSPAKKEDTAVKQKTFPSVLFQRRR